MKYAEEFSRGELRRSQYTVPSPRGWEPLQLTVPYHQVGSVEELEVGQNISVLMVFPGSRTNRWLLRGIHAATRAVGHNKDVGPGIRGVIAAANNAPVEWTHTTTLALWRGDVDSKGPARAGITLTHGMMRDDFEAGVWPGELPLLEGDQPAQISARYEEMGLRPIPAGEEFAGRWLPYVTVAF